jgi:sec-independent protein translocase protein TatA
LLVALGIVVLLFGVGRVGQLGGELGRAIREFRRGLHGDDAEPGQDPVEPPARDPASPDQER